MNTALSANPIGLVIVAVAALAAGIVIAYQKSDTFRGIVQAAFAAVKVAIDAVANAFKTLLSAAASAFDWITDHWKVALFAFGPIGAAIALIVTHFHTLESVATAVFGAIQSAISGIAGAIQSVIGAVQSLIDAIGRIHVPHINLPGPFAAPAPANAAAGRAGGGVRTSAAGGITVNVYGAIDAEGTARAIVRVLSAHDRRQGR